ncbi:MAG: hypothetical protein JNJ92_04910 [Altererythrobacter sp.]|nr:hypothetical protein [Altererythrobacter sp.]
MALVLLWSLSGTGAIGAGPPPEQTRVIVLGVDHSAQLVSRAYRAAVMEAFFDRVKPDAICVERDPENFATGDFYEFTYEVSDIAVPYVRDRRLGLCPFDWMPSKNDQVLGFGLDMDAPPPVRPAAGFQGFLTFPDKAALRRGLFWAEDRSALTDWDAFADRAAKGATPEMSRRLFLYRTMLQARRIGQAARAWRGKTLLVVVGAYHERDIETFLAADPGIVLVTAQGVGEPDADTAARFDRPRYLLASLSFNLLGRQAATGNIDLGWMAEMLDRLEADGPTPETSLLRLRLRRLSGDADAAATLAAYRTLWSATPADAGFTWTGVKDHSRLDSFFDPFGNLTVRQRIRLEMAREMVALGRTGDTVVLRRELAAMLNPAQAAQLHAYWPLLGEAPARNQ